MKTEETQEKSQKKQYTTPKLSTHGDMATLTQHNIGCSGSHIVHRPF